MGVLIWTQKVDLLDFEKLEKFRKSIRNYEKFFEKNFGLEEQISKYFESCKYNENSQKVTHLEIANNYLWSEFLNLKQIDQTKCSKTINLCIKVLRRFWNLVTVKLKLKILKFGILVYWIEKIALPENFETIYETKENDSIEDDNLKCIQVRNLRNKKGPRKDLKSFFLYFLVLVSSAPNTDIPTTTKQKQLR